MSTPPLQSVQGVSFLIQIQAALSKLTLMGNPAGFQYTAISRKVVGRDVHAAIPKGNMGYDQYTVPDSVAVEPTFVAFV